MSGESSRAIRFTQFGLLANAALAIIKILAGVLGNSYALIADGIESTADILSYPDKSWPGLRGGQWLECTRVRRPSVFPDAGGTEITVDWTARANRHAEPNLHKGGGPGRNARSGRGLPPP